MDEKGTTQILEGLDLGVEPEATGGRSFLIVLAGGVPGAMLPLAPGGNWLGRGADNSLQLAEASVSRRHAVLRVEGPGSDLLTDLGSSNGTFLNGARLVPHAPTPIKDGDRVRIGSAIVLKYVRPDREEEQFQREMFERTVRDALTGLYNRSYFMHQLGPLAHAASRAGLGLAVMMIDIDHFKHFNDTYGHSAGDTVLKEVANALRRHARAEDLIARYGGEEFLLAIPAPDLAHALQRAERARQGLASHSVRLSQADVTITASIGVAFSPVDRPHAAGSLLTTADFQLYRAKEAGRNRVMGSAPEAALLDSQITRDGEIGPVPDPAAGTVPGYR